MSKNLSGNRLLVWKSTDGSLRSIISVEDTEKNSSDVDQKRFELCKYEKGKEQWVTEELLDYYEEIEEFGIPQELVD
jgi:hypothetical protein